MSGRRLWMLVVLTGWLLAGCTAAGSPPTHAAPGATVLATDQPGPAPTQSPVTIPTAIPPTNTPSPTQTSEPPQTYAVIRIPADGELLAYPGAGAENPDAAVPAQARGLVGTGQVARVGEAVWVEIFLADGSQHWVEQAYLTEIWSPDDPCSDSRLMEMAAQFILAVETRDGPLLASLVHPSAGLTIRHNWWNPEVSFLPTDLHEIFSDPTDFAWGVQDGSGFPLEGPFAEVILPRLEDAFRSGPALGCGSSEDEILHGGTAGYIRWPDAYANSVIVTIFRTPPEEQKLDWRSWALGFVYLDGAPYLTFLVQYHWEI